MRFSLRLALVFFVLSALPVVAVYYISTITTARALEIDLMNHLTSLIALQEANLNRWVESLDRMIESIAQRPLVVDLTAALVDQASRGAALDPALAAELRTTHLMPHLHAGGLYEEFALVDAVTGCVLVSTEPGREGTFRIGEAYFEEALTGTYVGGVKYTPALGRMTLHVGTPVARPWESPIAVLAGRVNLRALSEIIAGNEHGHASEDVYLVNRHGFFVTEPRYGDGFALQQVVASEGVERAIVGETGIASYTDYRGVSVLGAYRWIPERQFALIGEIDREEAFASVVRLRTIGLAVVLGAILVFAWVGHVIARRMTTPFRRIVEGAAEIGKGSFDHRIGMARRDEFGDLARAFDQMAEDLQEITASRDDLNREIDGRRRAEERFRLAAGIASDLIYEWDVETDELQWFGDIDGALGYDPGEIPRTLEGWVSLIHPQDQVKLSDAVERHRVETRPIHETYRIRTKDGEWRHWVDRGVPVHLGLDRPRRWIGVCIDDTERLDAYQALAESEGRFRRILENASDVIYRYRLAPDPGFEFISPAVYEISGYTPAEFYADPNMWISIVHPDYRRSVERLLRDKSSRGIHDMQWIRKDGQLIWIEDQHHRVTDEHGDLVAIEGVARDITEYKKAQEALRLSEEQYRSLFENAALGIYQTTPDGRIIAANPALLRMLGYDSFEDLSRRNLEKEGYEAETPRSQFKERIEREGRIEGMESIWIGKDGAHLVVRENAVVVYGEDGKPLFYEGTVEDITEQQAAFARQRELEAQLRQTQKLESIGTLASGVAHEINNPLTGIINYAELIRERVDDHRLKEFAESIMAEGGRVAEIVRNLLSFARREKETYSPARLVDILSAAMALVSEMMKKDRIHVDVDIPEDLPTLRCRSQQIQQVILNLLTNARDALNERYPKGDEDKRIRIRAWSIDGDDGPMVRTILEDYGPGIRAEHLDRIFDPFFTTKPRDRGTGLGLSVSYGIVREHHGHMRVESEPGRFTRVVLDLPIAEGDSHWKEEFGEDEHGQDSDR